MSAWKSRELELSPEEAIVEARKEFDRYWYFSDPLIAGYKDDNGRYFAFPIDHEMSKFSWLICFVDFSSTAIDDVVHIIRTWNRRFHEQNLKFLVVVRPSYQFQKKRNLLKPIIDKYNISFPLVLDVRGLIRNAFEFKDEQFAVALFDKNKIRFKKSFREPISEIELEIQSFLRSIEPGLPLFPPYELSHQVRYEAQRIEIKKKDQEHFTVVSNIPESVEPGVLYFIGNWKHENERMVAEDNDCKLLVQLETANMHLFARSLSKTEEVSRSQIRIDNSPVYDMFSGSGVRFDDEGNSYINFREPGLYHIVSGLPKDKRRLEIRFQFAKKAPIAFYAGCFSDYEDLRPNNED